ncbi:MAG: response regulator [Sphingomonadaceae bacterium]
MESDVQDPIRVMIADDHPLLRSGIAAVLSASPKFSVVAEACDGAIAIEQYQRFLPDITLMDIQMPGLDGIAATTAIRRINPQARIIILSTYSGDIQVCRGLKAGASGYIRKSLARTELSDYIVSIHTGQRNLLPHQISTLLNSLQLDSLSERETEVLRIVAEGNSNLSVAQRLGLSENTVKAHIKSILQKLDARDRTHAVMIALRRGYWEH